MINKENKEVISLKTHDEIVKAISNKPTNEHTPIKTEKNKVVPHKSTPLQVYALGGLGEVGKNMYVVEQGNEIWIMDAGIKFASDTVAAEGIIPSFEYLIRNQKKIRGLIVTHGHEDHIGAIPHLLSVVKVPKIYAGRLAIGLINSKLRERRVPRPQFEVITNKSVIKSPNFRIDFFAVNHSIPDCYGVRFISRQGTIVNTADFKFDLSPVGTRADIAKMGLIGQEGVTLLMSDSTNAMVNTFSRSEMDVKESLDYVVSRAKGRVIVATFASNVYRVREIINIAQKYDRKIAIFGYSMDKVVDIARKIKYINIADNLLVENPRDIKNIPDDKLLILSTGTQGETNAALSKMADGRHKEVKIRKEDTVVFASSSIPGNYEGVEKVTNKLIKRGCTVINNKIMPSIHASGHGGRQEQLFMFNLIKPEYFCPVHGETAMQITHAKTAISTGISKNKIFILNNGGRLKIENGVVSENGSVPSDDIYVDDTNLKGQSMKVIGDRNRMAKNGIAIVTVGINSKQNKIVDGPIFETKGIFHEATNKDLIAKLEEKIRVALENYYNSGSRISFSGLKEIIRLVGENEIFKLRRINPIVVPIILNYDLDLHKSFNKK